MHITTFTYIVLYIVSLRLCYLLVSQATPFNPCGKAGLLQMILVSHGHFLMSSYGVSGGWSKCKRCAKDTCIIEAAEMEWHDGLDYWQ